MHPIVKILTLCLIKSDKNYRNCYLKSLTVELYLSYIYFYFQMNFYRVRHITFFQLELISWMLTLSSCLIWQIISFILPPKEYGCVYAWTTLENIATDRLTENAVFGKKKIIFSDEAHFDLGGYVNKQNCSIWGTENSHAYIAMQCNQNESLFGADFGSEA